MDARNDQASIDGGRLIVGLGGVLLLVGLFLDWFTVGGRLGESLSAFTVFEIADLILAAIAVIAIFSAVEPYAGNVLSLPLGDSVNDLIAPVAFVIVAVSLANEPPVVRGAELEVGAWLSLAGAAIMCAGALLAKNRISLVVTPRERAVPVAPPPERPPADETETRPLPPGS